MDKARKLINLRNRIARSGVKVWDYPSWQQSSVEGYNEGIGLAVAHLDREIERWDMNDAKEEER